ncbi:MAG: aminopeptidase [Halodesulfurarchaeum sp.]
MDPRVEEHARIVVEHSAQIEPGDAVIVSAPPAGRDLVVAIYERLGEIGAEPMFFGADSRAQRAYMRAADPEAFETPPHALAAVEEADAAIGIRASENTHEESDVPPAVNQAFQTARQPVQEAMMANRWVATQHPAPGNAQDAEMSTEAYADFVYDAVNRDWDAQRAFQEQLVDILDVGETVHIESGEETDLHMRIDGMAAVNDYGEHNMPGGEVFTAPVPDSVEGTVLFDKPLITQGQEVTGVHLTFEGGTVTEFHAEKNEEVLEAVLDTDDGARRLGELGIGMNRGIDRFTSNMLFDEKMGDTVHMALGRAYEETVGQDREQNESAVHLDMIVDMSEDAVLEVDGAVVMRDGTFSFEDGFEEES